MENLTVVLTLAAEIIAFVSTLVPIIKTISKISNGTKCQLRNDMLSIYYKHCDTKEIRQYEYENFVMLYEAYKSLGGNSFIDKIYNEVKTWTIIP